MGKHKQDIGMSWSDLHAWIRTVGQSCGAEKTIMPGLKARYGTPHEAWENWMPKPGKENIYDYDAGHYVNKDSDKVRHSRGAGFMVWLIEMAFDRSHKNYLKTGYHGDMPKDVQRLIDAYYEYGDSAPTLKQWVERARKVVPWNRLASRIVKARLHPSDE